MSFQEGTSLLGQMFGNGVNHHWFVLYFGLYRMKECSYAIDWGKQTLMYGGLCLWRWRVFHHMLPQNEHIQYSTRVSGVAVSMMIVIFSD